MFTAAARPEEVVERDGDHHHRHRPLGRGRAGAGGEHASLGGQAAEGHGELLLLLLLLPALCVAVTAEGGRRERRRGGCGEVRCGAEVVRAVHAPPTEVAAVLLGADRGCKQTSGGRRLEVFAQHQRCPDTPTEQQSSHDRDGRAAGRHSLHLRGPAEGCGRPQSCALPTPTKHVAVIDTGVALTRVIVTMKGRAGSGPPSALTHKATLSMPT